MPKVVSGEWWVVSTCPTVTRPLQVPIFVPGHALFSTIAMSTRPTLQTN
jgi:hypothetical protein